MKLNASLKTVLTAIAVALVAIAIHLWVERVSPAQAQAANPPGEILEHIARRLSALEHAQREQARRIEALRSALQATVTKATGRGYFPDGNWSTVYWNPDVAPAAGG